MSEKITASKFNELYTFIHSTLDSLDYNYSYRPSWKDSNNNTVSDVTSVSQNSTILANNVNDYVLALKEIEVSDHLKSGLQYDGLEFVYAGNLIKELYFNSLLTTAELFSKNLVSCNYTDPCPTYTCCNCYGVEVSDPCKCYGVEVSDPCKCYGVEIACPYDPEYCCAGIND